MFPMRLKMGPSRNSEWRCFFCLHVRTATVLLGIWHLILHVLAISVLAIILRNHQQLMAEQQTTPDYIEPNNLLPTPLSKVKDNDNPYFLPTTQDGRTPYTSDMDMGAVMSVCTLGITLLMVYGTLKGRASHLLPFFCLQLFDFAITTLTATGYFCYLRSVHSLVADHWHNLPFRKELLQLSPQYLSLIVLVAFLVSMLWKAYCIGIIWRCYKFLTLRKQAMRSTVHYILPGDGSERLPEPDYSSLLPDYEAACASVLKQPPPPSYAVAMSCLPPAYSNTQISADSATNNDADNNNTTENQVIQTAVVENENTKDDEQPQGNITPTVIVENANAVNNEQLNTN